MSLHTQGDRIVVGDVQESFHFVKYKYQDNQLIPFADDTLPRWITGSCMLDYNTVAGGDKFGNFFVDRLPSEVSDEVDDDPSANRIMFERGQLNGTTHKVTLVVVVVVVLSHPSCHHSSFLFSFFLFLSFSSFFFCPVRS